MTQNLIVENTAPTQRETVFQLERVCFDYGEGIPALRDVSLTISRGEKVALLGANGCGKSTLLKILNGLLHTTSGVFQAFGEEITEKALRHEETAFRFRRRVGFIFQNSEAQLFSTTVRDEIAFGPLQMSLSRAEIAQRIADLASMLGIESLLDRPPFRLSGGEKKKVAIASVLALNPDVLLLDEPTNGLDPRSQQWLVELLVRLNRAGKTLVTATHDLDLVPHISDRVVVMDESHAIAAIGTPQLILENTDLLLAVNLIHEHSHRHGTLQHSHLHTHHGDHAHDHA
jgi:cobalt/nickel transport system ATP-binding protein